MITVRNKEGEIEMAKKKQKKKNGGIVWIVVMLAAAAVFIFSAYKVVTILREYKEGVDTYEELETFVTAVSDTEEAREPEEGEETGADRISVDDAKTYHEQPGIEVDFAGLQATNPDIIGWLYFPALEISYPILHGEDNEYYLHRLADKTYNFSGSIFMETENTTDFEDCNTIIYGHNMKNGSMFGKLKKIRSMEMTEEERKVWIITPEDSHLYRIFSANEVRSAGDVYTLFSGPGEEFTDWLYQRAANSIIEPGDITFGEDEKVITLSTCTGNEATRFVVIAQRIF